MLVWDNACLFEIAMMLYGNKINEPADVVASAGPPANAFQERQPCLQRLAAPLADSSAKIAEPRFIVDHYGAGGAVVSNGVFRQELVLIVVVICIHIKQVGAWLVTDGAITDGLGIKKKSKYFGVITVLSRPQNWQDGFVVPLVPSVSELPCLIFAVIDVPTAVATGLMSKEIRTRRFQESRPRTSPAFLMAKVIWCTSKEGFGLSELPTQTSSLFGICSASLVAARCFGAIQLAVALAPVYESTAT